MSNRGAKILVADDDGDFREAICKVLAADGHQLIQVGSGEEVLEKLRHEIPDLIILDLNFSGISGFEVCREIRQRYPVTFLPILIISGDGDVSVQGIEAGAYDCLHKPVSGKEVRARVASFLKMKHLYDSIESQRVRLQCLSERQGNVILEQKAKMDSFRRFFSPQIAQAIETGQSADIVRHHKQDVTICFVDLRGFTAFAEIADPDTVIEIISDYYRVVCSTALSYGGTISSLAGDGIMIFFNDPIPVKNHTAAAVNFLFEIRGELSLRADSWFKMGYKLGFGAGMARGESIVGAIGFEQFVHYTAISATVNLAARLCKEAQVGQILATLRGLHDVEGMIELEPAGVMNLKGISVPVHAFNLLHWKKSQKD